MTLIVDIGTAGIVIFFDRNGDRPGWEPDDWGACEAGKKQLAVVPACRK
tara:strand:+ start:954 stop:1100 length:147 start_codon:yes stop_codon:yes gene_type:complete